MTPPFVFGGSDMICRMWEPRVRGFRGFIGEKKGEIKKTLLLYLIFAFNGKVVTNNREHLLFNI